MSGEEMHEQLKVLVDHPHTNKQLVKDGMGALLFGVACLNCRATIEAVKLLERIADNTRKPDMGLCPR